MPAGLLTGRICDPHERYPFELDVDPVLVCRYI